MIHTLIVTAGTLSVMISVFAMQVNRKWCVGVQGDTALQESIVVCTFRQGELHR